MSRATRINSKRALVGSLGTTLGLLLLAAPALRAQGAAVPKIAVIDVQQIVTESETGKKVFQELESFGKKKQEELDAKRKEIEDLRAKIEAGKNSLAEEKLKEMADQLDQKGVALNRSKEDAQSEFNRRQQEMLGRMEQKVLPIINQVGKEGAYTFIFRKFDSGLIYADEATDITKMVIVKLDAAQAGAAQPAAKPGN
ncbi:MAG TPA: OmpH family outer membrane protein [Thermoanaerobaculia bacterium]|nr:OmpH family outer membrane protein [Thermoanaerobaculia bacterium]